MSQNYPNWGADYAVITCPFTGKYTINLSLELLNAWSYTNNIPNAVVAVSINWTEVNKQEYNDTNGRYPSYSAEIDANTGDELKIRVWSGAKLQNYYFEFYITGGTISVPITIKWATLQELRNRENTIGILWNKIKTTSLWNHIDNSRKDATFVKIE